MKWTPEPYQRRAVRHLLANPAAGLFLRPGLRKTSCTLRAAVTLLEQDVINRVLVMAPVSVMHAVWPAEARKWDFARDLRVEVLHGPGKEAALDREADLQVINYEGLAWLDRMRRARRWKVPAMLVADESTKIKHTTGTQRYGYVRELVKRSHRRVALTGTPSTNGLMDLFGQLYFLDGGQRLRPYKGQFQRTYFTQVGPGEWLPHPDAEGRIAEAISDICFTLRANESLALPDLMEVERAVQLPAKARRVYRELANLFYAELDAGVVTAANAAVKSGKLRQVCGGAVYLDDGEKAWDTIHDAKLEALGDLLEEIGRPAIVAYEYDHERQRLEHYFGDGSWKVDRVAGTKRQRQRAIDRWNAQELDLLLCHPASAGHGLNLQAGGEHILFFSPTWNLEHHDQLIGRLHRSGQKNTVIVHTLVAADTIEQRVIEARKAKAQSQTQLLRYIREHRG